MADDSSDGSDKDRSAPTVRDSKGPAVGDTLPDLIGMYVPPRPLPESSQHRTLDLKSVRLSDQADPRRALTERRLVSPPRRTHGSLLWLALSGLVLIGALAWFLLGGPAPSAPNASLAAPAAPAPVVRAQASAAAPKAVVTTPRVSTSPPVIAPSKASSPSAEASPAPAPKTSRPRESAKKRKDPWLE